MSNDRFNGSGCKDITAYKAIKEVSKEQRDKDKDMGKLIQAVKYIIDNAGYELVNRIVIKDKDTKKIYR